MRVRIYIRVALKDGTYPFVDPVKASNGRLKPGYGIIGGKAEHHPEGIYYLRYLRNGKRIWERIGPDPALALTACKRREFFGPDADTQVLIASAAQMDAARQDRPVGTEHSGIELKAAAQTYLAEAERGKMHKTYLGYRIAVDGFVANCSALTVTDVQREDVLTYINTLRKRGLTPRTISNRLTALKTFLRHYKVAWPLLKTDRVRYTVKAAVAYNTDELRQLFAFADEEETDLFQFLLCTGCREQEVMHATWRDVDFTRKTFTVTEKLDLGFTPKDKEEGAIPIPDSLVIRLRARRKRYPDERRIFPSGRGGADGHFLRRLQKLAFRAGLNCGECFDRKGRCCAAKPICHHWGLHRFRKTFATMHHEAGVPARTIQRWLRHSSLDTTLRYLAGSDDTSDKTRGQVNSTFAGIEVAA